MFHRNQHLRSMILDGRCLSPQLQWNQLMNGAATQNRSHRAIHKSNEQNRIY